MTLRLMTAGEPLETGRTYYAIVNLLGMEALLGSPADVRAKLVAAGFSRVTVSDDPLPGVPVRRRFKNGSTLWARGVYSGKPGPLALPKQVRAVWAGPLAAAAPPPAAPVVPAASGGGLALAVLLAAAAGLLGLPAAGLLRAGGETELSRIDRGDLRIKVLAPEECVPDEERAEAVNLPVLSLGLRAEKPGLFGIGHLAKHSRAHELLGRIVDADGEDAPGAFVLSGGRLAVRCCCVHGGDLLTSVIPQTSFLEELVVPST